MAYPVTDIAARIMHWDQGLVVVNKPFDIPTSGRSLEDPDALQYWVQHELKTKVWAVHQLDADTTGVNLFVTEKKLVKIYQSALAHPRTTKTYLAIVHGTPPWKTVNCTAPLGKVGGGSLGVTPSGKNAHSFFEVVASCTEYAAVKATITTGRTHQIRLHLTHLGFPLVGDDWYGVRTPRHHFRQALHAQTLQLAGPNAHLFTSSLPEDLVGLMHRIGLRE